MADSPTVDDACRALRSLGWRSTIYGNRIRVNDRVFARHVDEGPGPDGSPNAKWVVYGLGDRPAVRIVIANGDPSLE